MVKIGKDQLTPGTMIKFREWDDMAEEYGIEISSIQCRNTFVHEMRGLCGKLYAVTDIDCRKLFNEGCFKIAGWAINTDMFTIPKEDDISNEMEYVNITQIPRRGW